MNLRNLFTVVLLGVFFGCGLDSPKVASPGAEKAAQTAPAQWLFVAHSEKATLDGDTLTLEGASHSIIAFTDRPVRKSTTISWAALAKSWAEGKDSFQGDPPNAVLGGPVIVADGKSQHCSVVLELVAAPQLGAGSTIALTVKVLRREPGCSADSNSGEKLTFGNSAIFIDPGLVTSDRRLKSAVCRIGTSPSGISIY